MADDLEGIEEGLREDQTVPIDATGRRMTELCPKARLVEYEGAPHGLPATHPQRLARDLVDFCKGR